MTGLIAFDLAVLALVLALYALLVRRDRAAARRRRVLGLESRVPGSLDELRRQHLLEQVDTVQAALDRRAAIPRALHE